MRDILAEMEEVTDLQPVADAHVPVMKFKFQGISIDLLYASVSLLVVPQVILSLFPLKLRGDFSNSFMLCYLRFFFVVAFVLLLLVNGYVLCPTLRPRAEISKKLISRKLLSLVNT